jgi:dynein light chain Tctex-type 1
MDTETNFAVDDIETVIKSSIGSVLTDTQYDHTKVNDQINSVISACLKGLQSLNRPYKYVTTAILMQKNGAGLVSAASTYWDADSDGLCKILWENQTTHCVVTVFGCCLGVAAGEESESGGGAVDEKKDDVE